MTNLETLIASLLYLMTRYSKSPQKEISKAIVQHLEMLASHPANDAQVISDAAQRLSCDWRQELRIRELGLEQRITGQREDKSKPVH